MSDFTPQLSEWTSEFGRDYTDRNCHSVEELDRLWENRCGVRKSAIFQQFLGLERLPCGRVLEVGCNVGTQLRLLATVNPRLELYGVEPQPYALAKARHLSPDITFVPGNIFEIPFRDRYFDLVMTNGVLIHLAPDDLPRGLAEMVRCSRRFVFLCEYFSEQPREVRYRDRPGLLWKMNYAQEYLRAFPNLRMVEERRIGYRETSGAEELTDQICLLEKYVQPDKN